MASKNQAGALAGEDIIFAAAAKAVGNGDSAAGFVANADPGLKPEEYITIPFGSVKSTKAQILAAVNTEDLHYTEAYLACLHSDAPTVATFVGSVPDEAIVFIAANRANTFAAGYCNSECTVATVELDVAARKALRDKYPHIAAAASCPSDVGNLAIFATAMLYWKTNHNVGGSRIAKGYLKAATTALSISASTDAARKAVASKITRAYYLAGHGSDKRITLRSILPAKIVNELLVVSSYRIPRTFKLDVWAKKRVSKDMMPANCASINLLKVLLNDVINSGLGGFAPVPEALESLKVGVEQVAKNPGLFHPGATYLFGKDVIALAVVEDLKRYIGIFGGFALAANRCISIVTTTHVQGLIDEHGTAAWIEVGKTFAKGVDLDSDKIKAAMSAVGVASDKACPDPTVDAAGYATFTKDLKAALASIPSIGA